MKRLLFIDRDGTIIKEPADEQIDSFEKLEFVEGAITNLSFIRKKLDFEFVMVSNQDGLGTDSFPEDTFWPVHNFILKTLHGEGIDFDDMLIDRHFPEDNHAVSSSRLLPAILLHGRLLQKYCLPENVQPRLPVLPTRRILPFA